MPSLAAVFVLLALVLLPTETIGQSTPSDTSTVTPQDIFSLSEEDFQLWVSGRQPKAWNSVDAPGFDAVGTTSSTTSRTSTSSSSTVSTTTPRPTLPSILRTSTATPSTSSATTQATPTTDSSTVDPLDELLIIPGLATGTPSDGKSWFEDEDDSTVRPDVLGDQFKPAGEDYAQWLERQMNKVQEVTFTPPTTLAGDPFPGLVTRLTTTRNRIPAPVTFAPSSVGAVTLPPPATNGPFQPAPPPSTTTFTGGSGHAPAPSIDLEKWLRDQLQLSQSLTDRLLAQWTPGGSFVRADGHSYRPSAVSYQSSALFHGVQGVSHSAQIRNDHESAGGLPFPGTSHSTDSYLSHQHHQQQQHQQQQQQQQKPGTAHQSFGQPAPTSAPVYYPAGSFYYSQPVVPHYGAFVGSYRAPVVINYH